MSSAGSDPQAAKAKPTERVDSSPQAQPNKPVKFLEARTTPALSEALSGYPVWVELPVQWGDQDAFNHVNNVTFFRWIETSRIAYAERIGLLPNQQNALDGPTAAEESAPSGERKTIEGVSATVPSASSQGAGLILASVACHYRKQVTFPDSIVVAARVQQIGNSSMKMQHLLFSQQLQAVVAEGHGTVVFFDYAAGRSRPLPQRIRSAIAQLEGSAVD